MEKNDGAKRQKILFQLLRYERIVLMSAGEGIERIACNLWAKNHETGRVDGKNPKKRLEAHPYFTQTGKDRESNGDQYIANMRDGATAGFKYFTFDGTESRIALTVRGTAKGAMQVSLTEDFQSLIAETAIALNDCTMTFETRFAPTIGKQPLYIRFVGSGVVDFIDFTMA